MLCVDSTQSVEETIHHGNFYLVLPENSSNLHIMVLTYPYYVYLCSIWTRILYLSMFFCCISNVKHRDPKISGKHADKTNN